MLNTDDQYANDDIIKLISDLLNIEIRLFNESRTTEPYATFRPIDSGEAVLRSLDLFWSGPAESGHFDHIGVETEMD